MIALVEHLKTHLPFSLLNDKNFKTIEESGQIAYYPQDTVLIDEQSKPSTFFLIIKGIVEARDNDELIDIYHNDDIFAGIEIVKDEESKYRYTVTEELICYEIPKEVFLALTQENKEFKNFFFSTILDRMNMLHERKEYAKVADMMIARVDDSILQIGAVVDAETPIMDALAQMEEQRAVAVIVKNDDGYGIVTDSDFRNYILKKDIDNLIKISQIQTKPIVTIEEGELLFNVLLLMTGKTIKHLPVFSDNGDFLGILEMIDLLSLFSNQSHIIAVQMNNAEDIESIVSAAQRLDRMINTLHFKGVKSRYIAKMVSEIHKKMYTKIFQFIFPPSWHDHCTLLLLGSEGRGEQILRTDQDNALIFEDGFSPENKEEVLNTFIETLDIIGFPRCKGNVMVINPKWAKGLQSFKDDIREWISSPSSHNVMDIAILFDTFAVAGNKSLYIELRTDFMERIDAHKEFLPYFARSIESFESPLDIFSRIVSTDKHHQNEIDIKKGALFPLIHGIRALAMEFGIYKTNTTERIKELNTVGYMTKEDAHDLLETLEVMNKLRLNAQLEKLSNGIELDNYINLRSLGKLERDTLKEALKSVEKFKKRVSYHFHLSMVS